MSNMSGMSLIKGVSNLDNRSRLTIGVNFLKEIMKTEEGLRLFKGNYFPSISVRNLNGKLFTDSFTTIRLETDPYWVGDVVSVVLNNSHLLGYYHVRSVTPFNIEKLNDTMSYLDMGVGKDEGKQLLKTRYKTESPKLVYIRLKSIVRVPWFFNVLLGIDKEIDLTACSSFEEQVFSRKIFIEK